ncbi:ATP-binding cassette domain-containing protein [Methyloligella sp. 2.7D]|uniref:ATP-binding cassette domain-containing protein n=1 Tax=unclassified Methyloligella TaxID=2625955 RepID=UPI00157BF29A|nr:ATP-binding cassette domain-containing protein [Methyloligella sp. GL2]QKP78428.1 ABC transporter ATP-binding protein [Methyloligella sp. GL2]
MTGEAPPPLIVRDVVKSFKRETGEPVLALDHISFEARQGTLTALVGPDAAGKTTLIRLATGLITPDEGSLQVAGFDAAKNPQEVQDRIGYMPQRFGLYEDLTVQENFDLYADLHGVSGAERARRYNQLMEMTALGPFRDRLAGRLSGGMKQKLGLACTLVRTPELLLLDEPTVGVDPLSRRELWDIILHLVHEERHTVLLSTSYLDEAERCDHTVVLYDGKPLAQGKPEEISAKAEKRSFLVTPPEGQNARNLQAQLLQNRTIADAVPHGGEVRLVTAEASTPGAEAKALKLPSKAVRRTAPRFEDGFMVLLHGHGEREAKIDMTLDKAPGEARGPAVEVHDLVRKFGAFTAVDHISFSVKRGEIFGLLGPNGAGKTTTFRMLCGLLPASSGTLCVAGADLHTARASARERVGYMAQKFSLYGALNVTENLDFFARAYGLLGRRKRQRLDWAMTQFELREFAKLTSEQLPGGYKQRLAMAAALLHEPDILFLDEATSGADPMARREFWSRINALAEQGVTVIITTHFMEEAEYCDRAVIMDAGRLLAEGTPAELRGYAKTAKGHKPSMEDAFIAIVEEARKARAQTDEAA